MTSTLAQSPKVGVDEIEKHESPKRERRPRPSEPTRPAVPLLLAIEDAARTLQLTPEALRARCRRAVERAADGTITAPLAPGVVAVKLGKHWRIRFA
jgi:hypothetical protein